MKFKTLSKRDQFGRICITDEDGNTVKRVKSVSAAAMWIIMNSQKGGFDLMIENFKVGKGDLPKKTFHVAEIKPDSNEHPLATKVRENRVDHWFEELFENVGGVDNLVFYKNTDNTRTEVLPMSTFVEGDYLVHESCFKVIDISKVSDFYKPQVEIEEI